MFQERRSLAIKAAKQRLKGIPSDHKPDPDESRRGLGIDPLESKILGPRKARNIRKKQERDQIFAYQSQASRDGEDWSHVYDEVAAQVNAEGSAAHQLTAESAAAAHKLAEAEHRKLFRESPSLQKLSLMTPVATCPARARRRRESLSPTGEVPTREDSLAALDGKSTNFTLPKAIDNILLPLQYITRRRGGRSATRSRRGRSSCCRRRSRSGNLHTISFPLDDACAPRGARRRTRGLSSARWPAAMCPFLSPD